MAWAKHFVGLVRNLFCALARAAPHMCICCVNVRVGARNIAVVFHIALLAVKFAGMSEGHKLLYSGMLARRLGSFYQPPT